MGSPASQHGLGSLVYRKPSPNHGKALHALVGDCPPLDGNSTYAYLILCAHFADTCVVAEEQGRLIGFISAYRKPAEPNILFVWQVAVHPCARGCGVGSRMLLELLARSACSNITEIETTVSPDNRASWTLFESLAAKLGAETSRETFFQEEDFGEVGHEAELLLRIGPFDSKQRGKLCRSLKR